MNNINQYNGKCKIHYVCINTQNYRVRELVFMSSQSDPGYIHIFHISTYKKRHTCQSNAQPISESPHCYQRIPWITALPSFWLWTIHTVLQPPRNDNPGNPTSPDGPEVQAPSLGTPSSDSGNKTAGTYPTSRAYPRSLLANTETNTARHVSKHMLSFLIDRIVTDTWLDYSSQTPLQLLVFTNRIWVEIMCTTSWPGFIK